MHMPWSTNPILSCASSLPPPPGQGCANGLPPKDTVTAYGASSSNALLPALPQNRLYLFPSMNFSCDGTITDIRMRMDFIEGVELGQRQEVAVYLLLLKDRLSSPTREVTHVQLLNRDSMRQMLRTEIWTNSAPLSLHITQGTFIGLAVPGNRSLSTYSKAINLSPTSHQVEAEVHRVDAGFSEFEGRVLEVARTADSSQFTTQMIAPPLIDVTFSNVSVSESLLCNAVQGLRILYSVSAHTHTTHTTRHTPHTTQHTHATHNMHMHTHTHTPHTHHTPHTTHHTTHTRHTQHAHAHTHTHTTHNMHMHTHTHTPHTTCACTH